MQCSYFLEILKRKIISSSYKMKPSMCIQSGNQDLIEELKIE